MQRIAIRIPMNEKRMNADAAEPSTLWMSTMIRSHFPLWDTSGFCLLDMAFVSRGIFKAFAA
jgi:hypothetical protein